MKKICLYIFLFGVLITELISCGDNTDFSVPHILTPDEIEELARQDSIKQAQKNQINANLILQYSVDITISQTLYEGTTLAIDLDKIANLFGISKEELLAGIAGETDAPEIKGFAIEGTTHADNMVASNTNAPWGHWWDANGNVTTWGDNAMVFTEFDTETGEFSIGQYPGHLTDGQKITIIECLKYKEKRVAVVITITAHKAGQIAASIVNIQQLTLNVIPKSDYSQDPLLFDLDQTLRDLGVTSMDEVKFIGVKDDGSFTQETTTQNGFWYDINGFVCTWGDNAKVFTTYGDPDAGFGENYIGIGQMPDKLGGGQKIIIQYGFLANNKIEMLKITINVIEYEDPETKPVGDPCTVEKELTITKPWSNDYASINLDIKDILKDAFKMTTYQIHKAIVSGDLRMYVNKITAETPTYTADAPGYWINKEGEFVQWAEGVIWLSLGHNNTELYLYGGNHPDNAAAGDMVKTKLIISCNGGEAVLNVTFNITD